jgi:Lon protease-like protein
MAQLSELPLFPLGTVLFPGMVLPLHIFEERYRIMIQRCINTNSPFGVVLIREGSEVGGGNTTIFDIGTTAHITQVDTLGDGRMNIATLGVQRFRIHQVEEAKAPYLVGMVEEYPFSETNTPTTQQEAHHLAPILGHYLEAIAALSNSTITLDQIPEDATTLAFLTAIILRAPMEEKQNLLSMTSLRELLREERKLLLRESHLLRLMTKSAPRWREENSPFSPN